ncbi:MAG: hypothetical protein QG671_4524 [Actinomycetota bacterium]|nr:hypothetical protein [Actinomycetota bacterium]
MSRRNLAAVIAVLVVFVLTGCGAGSTGGPVAPSAPAAGAQTVTPQDAPSAPAQVGSDGQLIAIQSDNVQAAGYDDVTGTMTVLFDSGGLYEYYDVPPALWEDFVAAQPHPWSAVGNPRLVRGGVAYLRIG